MTRKLVSVIKRLIFMASIWRGPQEYITYELVPTSPAVSRMSASSNFDSFRDGLKVAVQVLFTNPSARAGYDTRSIFKRSLTGFNSEFSFS